MTTTSCKQPSPAISAQRLASIEAEMDGMGVRAWYDEMVASGESPTMAAMFATQRGPAVQGTDSEFMRREHDRMSSMEERQRDAIVEVARRAGINTHGKCYNGQLGKYNDPHAWVSTTSDVRKVAEEKGFTVKGAVNVKGPEPMPPEKVSLASDVLDGLEAKARIADPSLNERCTKKPAARRALREQLTAKHAPKSR